MYRHGPSCLARPRSGARWLAQSGQEEEREARRPEADEAPEVREELVARVRAEIATGTYDTEEKWEAALDRLGRRLLQ